MIYATGLRRAGLARERVLRMAESFGPYVRDYAPGFWDEIRGLARGAAIAPAEAVLLQVRQEVFNVARFGGNEQECTTVAVSGRYTASGQTLAGQNADLSGNMERLGAVIRFAPPDKPRVVMLTPAGQISYIGMSSAGLVACANFLCCVGWRTGFPRYLLTRLALEQSTLPDALAAVLRPPRASSRNLMLTAGDGGMVDVETTAQAHACLWAEGRQVHTNHFLSPGMRPFEASLPAELANSVARFDRMGALVEAGKGAMTVERLQEAWRDHANAPDSICAHRRPDDDDHTFASLIAQPEAGKIWVACGPPCAHPYIGYDV